MKDIMNANEIHEAMLGRSGSLKQPEFVEFMVIDSHTGARLYGAVSESLREVFFGTGANFITRNSRGILSAAAIQDASGTWQLSHSKKARHVYVLYREVHL